MSNMKQWGGGETVKYRVEKGIEALEKRRLKLMMGQMGSSFAIIWFDDTLMASFDLMHWSTLSICRNGSLTFEFINKCLTCMVLITNDVYYILTFNFCS